jgi:phosphoribosylglycinamide formyltransferase-1
MKLLVLVSGGGTNLQAIIDAIAAGTISNTEITGVISNNQNAYALERAMKHGIPAVCIRPQDCGKRSVFHQRLYEEVKGFAPDLIVTSGFLVKVPDEIINDYSGRIINIHPSLIPAFCGAGYYGLTVHEKALARGVKITGATVHYVDGELDAGPILKQIAVEVLPDDTPEILQRRVMEQGEWIILPQVIAMLAEQHMRSNK